MKKMFFTTILLVFFFNVINAQIDRPVKWSFASKIIGDKEAIVFIKGTIEKGWHIYSTKQAKGGPFNTRIYFSPADNYLLKGNVVEPTPITKREQVYDMNVFTFEDEVTFLQKIKFKRSNLVIKCSVEFMACTDKKCLNPETVNFEVPIK
ncbi:Disulphide bond corrector protein DsbC [Mucilaginibacter pineti]|uniref:Disulphide bond corrector protein DsbC n=1 Tax=Mucilaginibacter pineti TaxID=1391627 RepID=A0A1G7EQV9_9SPHI|nr:protein-disulfide reductase DsbD domain-containing protein [Mucilaginibacter pineti]SDE66078.1 Disulphide bond corrector protein DsbC [Mucilaginibacter pineti]